LPFRASNVEPLTKDEETSLFRQPGRFVNFGDEEKENVARRLVESQLGLVLSIAQNHSASGVPMLDLIEEENIGLMDAVRSLAYKPIGDFTALSAGRAQA
jgi:DNA-directed RNA polymerase sigma subunit (sigma70/sigma32)